MSVKVVGDFIVVNDNITIKISDITSIRPCSLVKINPYTGKILVKDFPKIIISTSQENHEILYITDKERDKDLINIKAVLIDYSLKINNMKNKNSVNINISDSSNVNVVSQSSNVTINQKKDEVYAKLDELLQQLETIKDIDNELKNDIIECVNDIKQNVENNKKVPKYSLSGLLDLTSKVASLSSLGIGIAQLLGA